MMEYSVSDGCFVDVSEFRITNKKVCVCAVLVFLVIEIPAKLKDFLLEVFLKLQDISLFAFALLKFFPRRK
jgi:hypothetical protein